MLRYDHGGDIYGNGEIKLDFSVNTNPLGMPEGVKRAVISHAEDYARYPDPRCRALTAAIAAHHGLSPEMVLCGNGAADLIFRICACLRPERILLPAPAFSEYERAATTFGGTVWEYPFPEEYGFAFPEGFAEAITLGPGGGLPGANGFDLVFLCTPNNPTGRLIPRPEILRAAEACRESGAVLVLDECFIDFTEGDSMVPELQKHPNLLILRAFTKTYAMAGLRLGYLLSANAELLARIGGCGAAWSVSGPAQAAGLASLQETGWMERTRRLVKAERAFLMGALAEQGVYAYPSDANFLLLRCEKPLWEPLFRRGILVRDCANFTGLDARFIRIGIKIHRDNQVLISAVSEVLNG